MFFKRNGENKKKHSNTSAWLIVFSVIKRTNVGNEVCDTGWGHVCVHKWLNRRKCAVTSSRVTRGHKLTSFNPLPPHEPGPFLVLTQASFMDFTSAGANQRGARIYSNFISAQLCKTFINEDIICAHFFYTCEYFKQVEKWPIIPSFSALCHICCAFVLLVHTIHTATRI